MSHIDWGVAKRTTSGRGSYIDHHGRVSYRDGTGEKSAGYRIVFYASGPSKIHESDHIILGANGQDVFITTREMPNKNSRFELKRSKSKNNYSEAYGKDLAYKAIKRLIGIDPQGDVDITFNLKQINDEVFKFVDVEIV